MSLPLLRSPSLNFPLDPSAVPPTKLSLRIDQTRPPTRQRVTVRVDGGGDDDRLPQDIVSGRAEVARC